MAGNRFRGQRLAGIRGFFGTLGEACALLWRGARPVVRFALVAGFVAGFALAGYRAVHQSAYFLIRDIDVEASAHLDRAAIIETAGLDRAQNIFDFDEGAAREALTTHPWVATARVSKVLPQRIVIRLEERRASGAVVLDAPYLVDATGQPFAQAAPGELEGLPLVTGMTRHDFDLDPEGASERVQTALAVARRYALSPLAARKPLGTVHLAPAGRLELMLGRTRVALGQGQFRDKIRRLEQILDTLERRKVDAGYILLSEDQQRAIVNEIPRQRELGEELGGHSPEKGG